MMLSFGGAAPSNKPPPLKPKPPPTPQEKGKRKARAVSKSKAKSTGRPATKDATGVIRNMNRLVPPKKMSREWQRSRDIFIEMLDARVEECAQEVHGKSVVEYSIITPEYSVVSVVLEGDKDMRTPRFLTIGALSEWYYNKLKDKQ